MTPVLDIRDLDLSKGFVDAVDKMLGRPEVECVRIIRDGKIVALLCRPEAAPQQPESTRTQRRVDDMVAAEAPLGTVRVGTPEWDELTEKRAALIHKKNREGLSELEFVEFARLQRMSLNAITGYDALAGSSINHGLPSILTFHRS